MTALLGLEETLPRDGSADRRRAVISLLTYACWAGLAVLVAAIAARLIWPDRNIVLIWWNAYTFWVYLPAYLVVAVAVTFQKWRLVAGGAVVVLFHLWWVVPDYRGADAVPDWAPGATQMKFMTFNLKTKNPEPEMLVRELSEADPDIVLVQEYGPDFGTLLEESQVADRYPYQEIALETPYLGMAIYSKIPLADVRVLRPAGRQYLRAELEVDGRRVTLYAVHPTSPGAGGQFSANLWNQDWQALITALAGEPGPVILAGDLNMTQHHRWYGELKDLGLVNAHEARGRGNASTWQPFGFVPAIRLDHVFVSNEFAPLEIREGKGAGSDHRPVIARLALAAAD